MTTETISLKDIFVECNNFLREADKNRDQLIQFYLVVVGGYLAAIKAASLDQIVTIIIGLGIFLLGIVLTHSVTEFRLWHSRYSQTARLLVAFGQVLPKQYIQTEKKMRSISYQNLRIEVASAKDSKPIKIETEIRNPIRRFIFYFGWKLTGTEFQRFLSSLIITAFPLFIFLYFSLTVIFVHCPYLVIPFNLLIIGIYFLVSIYNASVTLYNENSRCPWATWLLDGLNTEWDFFTQKPRDDKQ